MNLPKTQTNNLIEQSLGKEMLIYDLTNHKALSLNETSTIVYQACGDGKTFEELKRRHKFSDDLIHLALEELAENNLLIDYGSGNHFKGLSRREAIRKVGLATMIALPVIHSIFAPTAAMAQSSGISPGSRTLGQSCGTSTDCAVSAPNCNSGTCCASTGSSPTGTTFGGTLVGINCATASCPNAASTCCSSSATVTQCQCTGPGGTPPCTVQCTCS